MEVLILVVAWESCADHLKVKNWKRQYFCLLQMRYSQSTNCLAQSWLMWSWSTNIAFLWAENISVFSPFPKYWVFIDSLRLVGMMVHYYINFINCLENSQLHCTLLFTKFPPYLYISMVLVSETWNSLESWIWSMNHSSSIGDTVAVYLRSLRA